MELSLLIHCLQLGHYLAETYMPVGNCVISIINEEFRVTASCKTAGKKKKEYSFSMQLLLKSS